MGTDPAGSMPHIQHNGVILDGRYPEDTGATALPGEFFSLNLHTPGRT